MDPDNKNKPREICPVKKGYGLGISGMGIYEVCTRKSDLYSVFASCWLMFILEQGVSPYSVLDKLGKVLPSTLDAMKAKQQAWQVTLFHFPLCV